jgi:hypothetical protein
MTDDYEVDEVEEPRKPLGEKGMEDWLKEAIQEFVDDDDDVMYLGESEVPVASRVDTFDDAGILTMNKGLLVELENGEEFQITIVQSREARGDR